ncbi:MAG: class I SAM-dependent DNA methyltransferase [Terrimonas sp.]|nr:class I SAM-dependent DNA methyltransferase [Terrimonas sp.]
MPLSWNEIKARATAFAKEWQDESNEDAEAKSFWDDFFEVFGISRRRVATFEKQVKKIDDKQGYIDLLWKGMILVEHKSRGRDLDRAYQQAKDYFPGLTDKELPKYILISDFARFRLYDLDSNTHSEFKITDFVNNVGLFSEIAGYKKRTFKEQDPVNIDAAELMGKLHDKLKDIGYTGHNLEVYLVRLVFCLFADDTNIFERGIFNEYLDIKTAPDGSDLAAHLAQLFEVLNTSKENRLKNLDESLDAFPYVNGKLFEEHLPTAAFDSEMRNILLECCSLDWGRISPAIFGSLFQSVMDEKARRNLGAHYTSEKNILKLIKPLFLDDLLKEFDSVKGNRNKLLKFHEKISKLRFLDPACGCGNFLIVAYRELRLLEIEVVKKLLKGQQVTDIGHYFLIDVDRFYGIEYEEFPAQIAQVAMWLIDHQMNMLASEAFGEYYVRLPLRKSATIKHGNALQIDWQSLIEQASTKDDTLVYDFILGNPPFRGKKEQDVNQKKDMALVFVGVENAGLLDYVSAWYIRAAEYLQKYQRGNIRVAFVSTNSITIGEQVGVLWNELLHRYKIVIHFAHRTFSWSNEAKDNAKVHVVIIGFSNYDIGNKLLYVYNDVRGDAVEFKAENINPYLVNGKNILIKSRSTPIGNSPTIIKGSEATDDGHLQITEEEREEIIANYPNAIKFIRPFFSGGDIINGRRRWCLWLKDISPELFRGIPIIQRKVEAVKKFRLESPKKRTQDWAKFPTLFTEDRQPDKSFLVFPKVSSERREYIPFMYLDPINIINNTVSYIPDCTLYQFGVLQSKQHMCWTWYVAGRTKSDIQYSNEIVYNNYPWPDNPTAKQKDIVEKAAQGVLDARAQFPDSSLADLYDPNTMPPVLVKAHQALDKAVDLCYRPQPFPNETKRIEFLFELYDKYTAGIFAKERHKKRK